MLSRPIDTGCQPIGFVDMKEDQGRYGLVAYTRPLTQKELEEFEMQTWCGPKKFYTMTDLDSGEIFELMDEQDILHFADEIFWDEPETEFTDVKKAIAAIEVSDYEVSEVKNRQAEISKEFKLDR